MELAGYIVLEVDGGVIQDTDCELMETEAEVINYLHRRINEYWEADRYANPDHCSFDSSSYRSVQSIYATMRKSASNMDCVNLSDDFELVVLKVKRKEPGVAKSV